MTFNVSFKLTEPTTLNELIEKGYTIEQAEQVAKAIIAKVLEDELDEYMVFSCLNVELD